MSVNVGVVIPQVPGSTEESSLQPQCSVGANQAISYGRTAEDHEDNEWSLTHCYWCRHTTQDNIHGMTKFVDLHLASHTLEINMMLM